MTIQKLVEPFAFAAPTGNVAGGKTVPFPVPSQISTNPGAASLNDGFTPLNMTPLSSGGFPMSGPDLNGILFAISAILTQMNQGLLAFTYDADFQTAIGGYPRGAVLQQAANTLAFWISTTAANMTDPDTGGAGWLSTVPLYSAAALSGPNDVVLPGPSDYQIDVDTSGAAVSFSGFVAQRDGQRITLSAIGANNLTLNSLTGSAAGNQIRCAFDETVEQNGSLTIQYSAGANVWILV